MIDTQVHSAASRFGKDLAADHAKKEISNDLAFESCAFLRDAMRADYLVLQSCISRRSRQEEAQLNLGLGLCRPLPVPTNQIPS
jgi:hypothetical protein